MSLFTPTRTEVVGEELEQCEGMDSVIQYDDVRGYFDRVGLPTPDSIPRRKTMHHTNLSLSSSTRTMPMSSIVGTPTAKALPPPILSPPAMKSLTPPLPLHHEQQTSSLFSSYHAPHASSSSICTGHQWQAQPMASPSTQPMSMFMPPDPNSLLSPTPAPIQQHQRPQPSSSSSKSHTHIMPPAPVPGPSRTRATYNNLETLNLAVGEEGSTAHTSLRKRSTPGGIRIVTVYDARGFEGVEAGIETGPQFEPMITDVPRTHIPSEFRVFGIFSLHLRNAHIITTYDNFYNFDAVLI
ncbi:hypothetical protein BJ165DRAFT_1410952 [Panaeolus papilionaceus]|nr:hypothetical protein BJ165DRAFT_1410952 [Panaeolus papilionaceus]